MDREGERRFFPLAETLKAETKTEMGLNREGNDNGGGREDDSDGVNVAANVDVEGVANEKN